METVDAVQARHRKEQRDLQSRITSKKKNATKKTRKGVNDECAELERQLKDRQVGELSALTGENPVEEVDSITDVTTEDHEDDRSTPNGVAAQLEDTSISDGGREPSGNKTQAQQEPQQEQQAGKKRNRQKERLARRAAEQEAQAEAAQAEAGSMTDHRAIEKKYLTREFESNGLIEQEIRPDGHCLFAAVADQLAQRGIPLTPQSGSGRGEEQDDAPPYRTVRRRATRYMLDHRDDFAPFLEEDLEAYAAKIRDTAEWGGQLELRALADVYGVEIKVVQDGRTETIEPGGGGRDGGEVERIWLAYYRHGYGLGEHYNSLRKKKS